MAQASKNYFQRKWTAPDTYWHEVKFYDKTTNAQFNSVTVELYASAANAKYDFVKPEDESAKTLAATTLKTLQDLSVKSVWIKLGTANDTVTVTAW